MQSKLTLRLDKEIIKKIKKVSQMNRISLSKMVSDYFYILINTDTSNEVSSPVLNDISGILKNIYAKDYKNHLEQKYL